MVQIQTNLTETTIITEIIITSIIEIITIATTTTISEIIFAITTDLFRDTIMKDTTSTSMVIRTDQTKT